MSQSTSLPAGIGRADYGGRPSFESLRPSTAKLPDLALHSAQETLEQPPTDAVDVTRRQPAPGGVTPTELSFPDIPVLPQAQEGQLTLPAVPPAFESDFSQAETVRLAALYLSDNPETVVQSGSGVLSPEQSLPGEGISRVTLYHSFVTEDDKQAYVTVSAAEPGSFHVRGQGVSIDDPLTASREANANYPNPVASLDVAILSASGGKRIETVTYSTDTQRYEQAIDLAAGERAFLPVGERVLGTAIASSTALDNAHGNASKTVVARVDIEPVEGARLAAGTYVEGTEKNKAHQGLQTEDYRRMQQHGEGDYVQSPITGTGQETRYGQYQGDALDPNAPKTLIKPHHSAFIRLDPRGVIPFRDADIGNDQATGRPFVRLIGARDGEAQVDDDLDGRFNEDGADVFRPENGLPLDRSGKNSNTEATTGSIDRRHPGRRLLGNEGERDGYGLPYQLPNRIFSRTGTTPNAPETIPASGDRLAEGQLILRGDPHQKDPITGNIYKCKYAVSVIDANNVKHDFLIGAQSNGTASTRNNFWALNLENHPMTLPIRVVSHEGSDLGVEVVYDPPGGEDLTARATSSSETGQMVFPYLWE